MLEVVIPLQVNVYAMMADMTWIAQVILIVHPISNQIRVVAFNVPNLTQASFLQKKSNVAKCFFDICNVEMAQSLSSLHKSEFLKLIILIFHEKN